MKRITFLNDNAEGTLEKIGLQHLSSTREDMAFFDKYRHCDSADEFWDAVKDNEDDLEEAEFAIDKWNSLGKFNEYGLDLSPVLISAKDSNEYYDDNDETDSIDEDESYVRYQMSYGGPSDEIRLYADGTIIYVFLDWFCGIGFDVSDEDEFTWLMDEFMVEEMLSQKIEEERGY